QVSAGVWEGIGRWIEERQGRANLYYTVNEARAIDSKPRKSDIVAICAAYTDADPDPSLGYETARRRVLDAAERMIHSEIPPTVVIDSGHGIKDRKSVG